MLDRVWWLNHEMPEDIPDPGSSMAKSFSNAYEVEMVVGLVEYLINSNEYDYQDITILTPYNGQLAALTHRLSGTCSLWLSEKDRESLLLEGLLQPEEVSLGAKTEIGLASMLRLATIDNFQGEESKVVILSTVRSNFESRVGFLKTPNRINVGCSRAKNGFYIVGNATLMSLVPMWRQIAKDLFTKGKIGPAFRVCCSRHPSKVYHVQSPGQWYDIPECQMLCGSKFPCGHLCIMKCHAPALHDRIGCPEPCPKHHEACGHQCTKTCGEPCGDCGFELFSVTLSCGHVAMRTCGEAQADDQIVCNIGLEPIQLECGHIQQPICSAKDQPLKCTEMCNQSLKCGHHCRANCHMCTVNKTHPQCSSLCRKELKCGHNCAGICHIGGNCPPCQLPCKRSCSHGSCSQRCSRVCDPCVRPCDWPVGCPHKGSCTMMCCLPCNQLPCSEPCSNVYLPCRHLCPSLCGEMCPAVCPVCRLRDLSHKTYMFLPCGHYFELEYLDRQFGLTNVYLLDTNGNIQKVACDTLEKVKNMTSACPTCGESCKNVRRYKLHYQLLALLGNIDRMHAKFSRKMNMFMEQLYEAKTSLDKSFNDFHERLRPGPLAGRNNADLVRHRGNTLVEVQSSITDFKDEIVQLFEDDIAKLAVFLGISPVSVDELPDVNLCYRLRFEALFFRGRLIILEESLRMLGALRAMNDDSEHTTVLIRGLQSLTRDEASMNIKALNSIITECEMRNLKRLEAEVRLIQMCFHILLKDLGATSTLSVEVSLRQTLSLCRSYPDTAGVLVMTYNAIKLVLNDERRHGNLYSQGSTRIWWSWPAHRVGSLKECVHGHQYSTLTWPGCPECGRKVVFSPHPEPVEPQVFLKEDAFVAAMRTQTFSSASYRTCRVSKHEEQGHTEHRMMQIQ